jgi:hypothetical protein
MNEENKLEINYDDDMTIIGHSFSFGSTGIVAICKKERCTK